MKQKSFKEMSEFGLTGVFGEAIEKFQSDYDLGTIEMILLLQSYQIYLVNVIAESDK